LNIYQQLSVYGAVALYVWLGYQILSGKIKQNLITWTLLLLLDVVIVGTLIVQHGNWQLPATYTCGCTCIVICILFKRNIAFTVDDLYMCILVIICIACWKISGPWWATIFATMSSLIASRPQLKDVYRDPEKAPSFAYFGYIVVNALSTIGGKSWTVEERFFPGAMVVLSLAFFLISIRNPKKSELQLEVERQAAR